ncbi:hypothetical protein ABZ260_48860, partial [Streptosporangium sp. NPDC006013]
MGLSISTVKTHVRRLLS